ncbi:MAG TPA: sensor domain-containing protein [Azospirillaceae bacterium]|nr:sensor domain-containing protein [Azospirillaceae bacterium]
MKVAFFYNAQYHQILHSLPFAFELSIRHPEIEVHILAPTKAHIAYIQALEPLYPGAKVTYRRLRLPLPVRLYRAVHKAVVPPKLPTLLNNLALFDEYDALVVTEKTSLLMKHFGVARPLFVHTAHGAGDRATAVDRRIREFDYALVPGPKTAKWLLELGHVTPGRYTVGAYAKFDIVRRMAKARAPLFDNGRPTVLYNPHFRPSLSSWPEWGTRVLDWFAEQDRYNLVLAPHIRLFDPPTLARYREFERWQGLPHIRIDLGSEASVDMTYTMGADLYMGDVSSQVYEFLVEPRPCLFLDSHGADWRGNPRYKFWTLGPVLGDIDRLEEGLAAAFAEQPAHLPLQRAAVAETFDMETTVPDTVDALAGFLLRQVARMREPA